MNLRLRSLSAAAVFFLSVSCHPGAEKGAGDSSLSRNPAPPPGPADRSGGDAGSQKTADSAGAGAQSLTPECDKLLQEIRELDKRVPVLFLNLKRTANEINQDMVQCIELSRRFLKECRSSAGATCDVQSILARMLLARSGRYREELTTQGVKEPELTDQCNLYQAEILQLAQEVLDRCSTILAVRVSALRTLIDTYERMGEYAKVRALCEELLRVDPNYWDRGSIQVAIGQSYLRERKYQEAVKYMRDVIDKHGGEPQLVLFNDTLFDALTGAGDLEGMEDLMELILAEYPDRIEKHRDDEYLKSYYESWLCRAKFWMGFARMALGDVDTARLRFQEQIDEAQGVAENLAGQNPQNNVCVIFANFRSRPLLNYLNVFYGKVPQVDFDLGPLWATEKKLSLKECRGKVVAIVFRRPRDARAGGFLQGIDALVKEHEKDGLVGINLGFLTGTGGPEADAQALQRMRDDLAALKVSLPAGFDPDRTSRKVFAGLHGTVGSASFVLLNREGESVWFLQDIRDLDREVARRVIERVLAEKDTPKELEEKKSGKDEAKEAAPEKKTGENGAKAGGK